MPQNKSLMNLTTSMDFIDLTSPPTSPEIITSNIDEYKIQKIKINKQNILCINLSPYEYSDLMVILDDLVRKLLPSSNTCVCANILFKQLGTALYRGNYYHLAELRSNGFIGSDIVLLAKLKDIQQNFEQLKKLVSKRQRIAKNCKGKASLAN